MGRRREQGTAGNGTASLRAQVFGGTAQIAGSTRTDLSGAIETNRVGDAGGQLGAHQLGAAQGGAGQGEFLTVREAASLLRLNVKTIYAAIRRGHLPAVRIGEAIRIPRWALQGEVSIPPPQPGPVASPLRSGPGGKTFTHLPLP
jgi:excisionase family DNA binding protein